MARVPLVCTVDNDEGLRDSLEGLFRSAGFAVRTFLSADSFLRWLTNEVVDCLVLDYAMPGMNGLELRNALLDRGLRVPIIFATAVSHVDIWKQLTSCGAFAVFAKPLDADALIDAVQRATATSIS